MTVENIAGASLWNDLSLPVTARVDALIDAMTIEE